MYELSTFYYGRIVDKKILCKDLWELLRKIIGDLIL